MENIINVAFENRQIAYIEGLTQWDKGYLLKVTGIEDLDGIVEVHFSLNETGGEAKRALATVENGTLTVDIANFILQSEEIVNYNAYAFIYPNDGDKAKTVRKIVFTVEARPKPADWVKPNEPDILVQLIEEIGNKADKAATISGYGIEDAYTKKEVDDLLADKVDKVEGKGLSANDFTDANKEKLNNLPTKMENDKVYASKTDLDTTTTAIEGKILELDNKISGEIDNVRENLQVEIEETTKKCENSVKEIDRVTTELIEDIGDIDTALDSIIAIQNELIGGA